MNKLDKLAALAAAGWSKSDILSIMITDKNTTTGTDSKTETAKPASAKTETAKTETAPAKTETAQTAGNDTGAMLAKILEAVQIGNIQKSGTDTAPETPEDAAVAALGKLFE